MRVTWVHPTWRDLVIERLAADDAARRRFLERSGPHGVVLALSVSGGAGGERSLPLLRGDQDWDVLGDRLYELTAELEAPDLIVVLGALQAALASLSPTPAERELQSLARMALMRVGKLWLERPEPVPLPVIEAWLQASKRLAPPLMPGGLATTWAELLPVRVPGLDDAVEMQRLVDWLSLCQMLADFSPAMLEMLGFGDSQVGLLDAFLQAVNADQERHADERLLRAVEAVAVVVPEFAGRALRHAHWVRDAIAPAFRPSGEIAPEPASDDPSVEGFSVSRVLADL